MSTFFRPLIGKRSALVFINDILLLADEKQEMFELIKELHKIALKENLKLAPENSFYMLLKVKFLGHEIGNNTIKPIPSKVLQQSTILNDTDFLVMKMNQFNHKIRRIKTQTHRKNKY